MASFRDQIYFLISISDLPNASSKLSLILFADDDNIFLSHRPLEGLFKVTNHELTFIADWVRANRLSLNLLNTNFVLFRSYRKLLPHLNYSLYIDNSIISQVKSAKFLGLPTDEHLTSRVHIYNIGTKIAKTLLSYLRSPIGFLLTY